MSKTAKKVEKNEEENFKNGQVYEIGYLFVPTLSQDELPKIYGDLKGLIENMGGTFISDEMPKFINLAYPMLKVVSNVRNKFDTGYFGWVKFEMMSDMVADLKKKLDQDPNIIRFMIIKTVRENTVYGKKFVSKETIRRKTAKTEGEEAPVEINKEELDKEIDAMIEV